MMLIRANILAQGLSGIGPAVAERLRDILNLDTTPSFTAIHAIHLQAGELNGWGGEGLG
jgi:hypothetical protein